MDEEVSSNQLNNVLVNNKQLMVEENNIVISKSSQAKKLILSASILNISFYVSALIWTLILLIKEYVLYKNYIPTDLEFYDYLNPLEMVPFGFILMSIGHYYISRLSTKNIKIKSIITSILYLLVGAFFTLLQIFYFVLYYSKEPPYFLNLFIEIGRISFRHLEMSRLFEFYIPAAILMIIALILTINIISKLTFDKRRKKLSFLVLIPVFISEVFHIFLPYIAILYHGDWMPIEGHDQHIKDLRNFFFIGRCSSLLNQTLYCLFFVWLVCYVIKVYDKKGIKHNS